MNIIDIVKCPKIQLSFFFMIASILILFNINSELNDYFDEKISKGI